MGVRLVVRASSTGHGAEPVYEFDQSRVIIGRGQGADVRLPHPAVSTHHATLRGRDDGGYVLVDEESTNGTRVNGEHLAPGRPKALRDGDTISLGGFSLQFETGVAVTKPTSADRTAALARRLVRDVLHARAETLDRPRLVVLNGPGEGTTLPIPPAPSRLVVGRGEDCDLVLADADASRTHLELWCELDGVLARDLQSKNGLQVNDRRVRERRLRDRDELIVGSTVMSFEEPAHERLRALEEQADEEIDLPAPEPASARPEGDAGRGSSGGDAMSGDASEGNRSPADEQEGVGEDDAHGGDEHGGPGLRAHPPRGTPATDVVIYLLAATVLAMSVAGLVLLLRA